MDNPSRSIRNESFLSFLDSDPEIAAEHYADIYRRLIAYFESNGCPSPEELVDETINRMIGMIDRISGIDSTHISFYLYGVARNVLAESRRRSSSKETEKLIPEAEKLISTPYSDEVVTILTSHKLSPHFLMTNVSPFLVAIADIQRIINESRGQIAQEVVIKSLSQNSPLTLNLTGASDAIQQVKDAVVPWRRAHQQKMARFAEQEKQAEIWSKKAEVLEKRALAAKDQAETERIRAEAYKQREEAERIKLENEKLRIELHRAKIQLALDILTQVAPNLSETDKIAYVVKLLPPLDTLIISELESSTE